MTRFIGDRFFLLVSRRWIFDFVNRAFSYSGWMDGDTICDVGNWGLGLLAQVLVGLVKGFWQGGLLLSGLGVG